MAEDRQAEEIEMMEVIAMQDGGSPVRAREPMRGVADTVGRLQPSRVPLDALAENTRRFLRQMAGVLAEAPTDIAGFDLEAVELTAGVTAAGKLTLWGAVGAEGGVSGGLKFVLKRRTDDSQGDVPT